MKRSIILLGWLGFMVFACKTAGVSGPDNTLEKLAVEKLGEFTSSPNATQEYLLCVQKTEVTSTPQSIRFIVIEIQSQSIVLQKDFMPGYVRWSGNYQVEWLNQPGIIRANETLSDYIQFANVRNPKL